MTSFSKTMKKLLCIEFGRIRKCKSKIDYLCFILLYNHQTFKREIVIEILKRIMKSNTFIFQNLTLRPTITTLRCNFLALISMDLNFSFSITLEILMRSYEMPDANPL